MDTIINTLADFCHRQWSNWTVYLFSKCIENNDGTLTIPKFYADRWKRQISTEYIDLSDSEQKSDQTEAQKIIDVLQITIKE